MKYKAEDRFGPLGLMIREFGPSVPVPFRLRSFIRPVLPREFHGDAACFRQEWLARDFSKAELGNEIEKYLNEFGEDIPDTGGGWRSIRPKQ
mgnify:CR=1 FL=1